MGAVSVKMHETWLAMFATDEAAFAPAEARAAVVEAAMTEEDRLLAMVNMLAAAVR